MSDKVRARIEESIHHLVAELLVRRVKDPRVTNVSITRVTISKDYSLAKILYNVIGGGDNISDIDAGLRSCRGFIRSQIKRRLRTRIIPELAFIYDASLDKAMEIEELIQSIHDEEVVKSDDDDDAE